MGKVDVVEVDEVEVKTVVQKLQEDKNK